MNHATQFLHRLVPRIPPVLSRVSLIACVGWIGWIGACAQGQGTPAGGGGGTNATGSGGSTTGSGGSTTGSGGSTTGSGGSTTGSGGSTTGSGGVAAGGRSGGTGGRGAGGATGGSVAMPDAGGVAGQPVLGDAGAPVNLGGRRALFIVDNPTGLDDGDLALQTVLMTKGMIVTLGTVTGPASLAVGQDVIIASGAASAADFATVFKDVAVPMIVFGNPYFLPLGFIGSASSNKGSASNPTQLTIINDTTHLTSDLTAGTMFPVIGTTRSSQSTWGTPGGAPLLIAAVTGSPIQLCAFAFEKGAAMATGTAAARRVAFGWRSTLTTDLSVAAFKLLMAAVEWTAGGAP